MLVAVTFTGAALESSMDQRFGRTAFFIVFDTNTMEYEAMENAGNRVRIGRRDRRRAMGGGKGVFAHAGGLAPGYPYLCGVQDLHRFVRLDRAGPPIRFPDRGVVASSPRLKRRTGRSGWGG